MKLHNGTKHKEDAFVEFNRRLTNAWKSTNEECLAQTTVFMNLLERILNFLRVIKILYKEKVGIHIPNLQGSRFYNFVADRFRANNQASYTGGITSINKTHMAGGTKDLTVLIGYHH
ncbi:hypothetical protein LguiB_021332 [Lonicera macranthoides]